MRQAIQVLLACTLSFKAAVALPQPQGPSWQPWGGPAGQSQAQAVYVSTNDVGGNKVVAISIDENGSLGDPKYYSTGGVGGNYVSPATGAPHFPDALSAQDAVVTAGDVSIPILPAGVVPYERPCILILMSSAVPFHCQRRLRHRHNVYDRF